MNREASRDTIRLVSDRSNRKLDFASGGWLLLGTVAMMAAVVVWRVGSWSDGSSTGAIGDGNNPASYGFDLSEIDPRIDRATLVGASQPKDGIPALIDPPSMAPPELLQFNADHRGKYLLPDDLVIGVEIDGSTRAYPLRILNWHEVINDNLADNPIAVTYHPLADSALVFDRRLDGEVLEFGVSGLLYGSNLLMFDRRTDPAEESLWLQVAARPISGPAFGKGQSLRPLPFSLARWGDWLARYPGTTLVRPAETKFKRYQKNPYGNYLMTGKLRFPVQPAPPEGGPAPLAPHLVIEWGDRREIVEIGATAQPGIDLESKGIPYDVRILPAGERYSAELIAKSSVTDSPAPTVRIASWFAVYSQLVERRLDLPPAADR